MGIRFYCPECGRKMNVKSFLAGKRGICPHCDARWEIPLESEIPANAPKIRPTEGAAGQALATSPAQATAASGGAESAPALASNAGEDLATGPAQTSTSQPVAAPAPAPVPAAAADPIAEAPEAVWYVRPASGGEFGPAQGDVMRRWVDEGRVGADSMVWREGWAEWQLAGPVFPSLAPVPQQSSVPEEPVSAEPKSLASLAAIQKKTGESNGRVARRRPAGRGKSIAAVVILGLLILALLVVLIVVVQM